MTNQILLEIGLEELPARFIDNAERQLQQNTKKWFEEHRISFDSIDAFSSPRRLAVIVNGVAKSQTTIETEVRGPSEKIAKNEDGSWSKAAIGFTKGQGLDLDKLFIKDVNGTPYVFVKKVTEGKKTNDILPNITSVISSIQFQETMHWNKETIAYARPIRWITALYDDQIIPFECATIQSSRKTNGHRFLGTSISLQSPTEYEHVLKENYVIANANKREQLIVSGIKELEQQFGFQVLMSKSLLTEVRNLVEYPTVFHGRFNESFLQLPREVLITAMEEHQRYFSVQSPEGKLLPYFISVRNGDEQGLETVIRGNERVLEARLSDAQFFYDEDQKHSLEFYTKKLKNVVFQDELGTYDDKVNRMMNIAKALANELSYGQETVDDVVAATKICKFDLMTQMVNEFPELQGVIGEKYALNKGKSAHIATAIREHYLPIRANGSLPQSVIGAILSITDKIDTIVGCLSIGLTPSGSQDPYGLRRQATGILRILQDRKWNITLESILDIALREFSKANETTKMMVEFLNFFKLRAQYILKENNIEHDISRSVLTEDVGVFHYTIAKAMILSKKRNDQSFKQIEEALVRVLNLAKQADSDQVDQSLFQTESERNLYDHMTKVSDQYAYASQNFDAIKALSHLSTLAEPIHTFFDHNLVMDDDDEIRLNRLALLNNIAQVVNDYADFTVIQWKQQA